MRNIGTVVSQAFTTNRSRGDVVFFDVFHFDRSQQRLWRGSEEITLRPKALALLHHLLQRPGQLVTKQELLDAVWPGTSVSDAVLKVCVSEIRRALGDGRGGKRVIETRHRRGYRLVSPPMTRASDRLPQGPSDAQVRVLSRESSDTRSASATRVIGRESELTALREHAALAARGERQTVFISGELGIGKSSVVDACLEQIVDRHEFVVVRAQCVEHHEPDEPFQPILEALSRLCRQPAQDRVLGLLATHAPSWVARIPSAQASAAQPRMPSDEPVGYARMIREMVDALESMAVESPVAFIIEDLQWADNATLTLMASLARPRTHAPVLMIGTSMPFVTLDRDHRLIGVKQDLQVHRRCVEIVLRPLGPAHVVSWMETRFPGAHGLTDLAALIHAETEGNPLFVSGVIDAVVAAGALSQGEKRWELTVPPSTIRISVPEHIHHTLDLQLERLSAEQRRILEAASVVGVEFTAAAVAAALDEDALPIEEWCETLVRRSLYLQSAGIARKADGRVTARFRFAHVFYQRVLYARILPRMRMRWHLRIDAHQAALGPRPRAAAPNGAAKRARSRR